MTHGHGGDAFIHPEKVMSRSCSASSSPWLPWLAAWLILGTLTLLLTPLTAWTALMGWAPALWLVVTPLLMLLMAEPRLPLKLLAAGWRRRSSRRRNPAWFSRYASCCAGVPCDAGTRA